MLGFVKSQKKRDVISQNSRGFMIKKKKRKNKTKPKKKKQQ